MLHLSIQNGRILSANGFALTPDGGTSLTAATPTFSPAAGSYGSAQTVTILCATAGSTIYYTTNGTTPTTGSTVYSSPITVNSTETVQAIATASGYTQSAVGSAAYTITSGATPIFSFPSGFSGASNLFLAADSTISGSSIFLLKDNTHQSAAAWYENYYSPATFTVTFTVQPTNTSTSPDCGMTFCMQNTQYPPAANGGSGYVYCGDANMYGYSGGTTQNPPIDSFAIGFFANGGTALYQNGGPSVATGGLGWIPYNDMTPYGINFYNNNVFAVTIVYDGSLLTMTIKDTVTNAQARYVWPFNLIGTTNAAGNFFGFTAGCVDAGGYYINTWSVYSGYNTKLTAPTFSPPAGQYSGSQMVTLNYPSGSTCYYTTNGLLPTSSSTAYSGPITVSANQVIQAVAIQSGYTDSNVALGAYQIGTTNHINFPSGFSAGNLVLVGSGSVSGSSVRVGNTTANTVSAAWYPAPVSIASGFSTNFALQWGSGASGQGMCFVMQNDAPAYQPLSGVQITGTAGQISFSATTISVGQYITVGGTFGGTGSISGYSSGLQPYYAGTQYYVSATNGSSTATLQSAGKSALTTTIGTPTGVTFSLHNVTYSGGTTVVGQNANAMGYGGLGSGTAYGILRSVAIAFNLYSGGSDAANSFGLYTNGATPTGSQLSTGLTFNSGHVFNCTLSYSGTSLSLSMTDATTSANYSHTFTIDIPGTVGGNTALVGFTGASGGATGVQSITAWTMT